MIAQLLLKLKKNKEPLTPTKSNFPHIYISKPGKYSHVPSMKY